MNDDATAWLREIRDLLREQNALAKDMRDINQQSMQGLQASHLQREEPMTRSERLRSTSERDKAPTTRSLAAIVLCLAAQQGAHASSLPVEVLGTWGLSEAAAELLAPNCRSLSYRFESDTLTVTSGEMVLTTRTDVDAGASPLSLRQVVTAFNLRPNCVGTLMPYALGQRIPDLRVEVQGDRLRLHLLERRGSTRHVDLVRINRPEGRAAASSKPGQ